MELERFQMLDHLVETTPELLRATATIPAASPVFEGHFPGHPLVPGVLLIETMAQAAGWLLLIRMGFARMPFLAGVREAKLRRFVGPGTPIEVTARLVHDGSGYAVASGRIDAEGARICDAELTLRILDFPTPELAEAMRGRARAFGVLDE